MKNIIGLILFLNFLGIGCLFGQEEPVSLTAEQLFYAYFHNTGKTPADNEINGFIAAVYPTEYRNSVNNEFSWRRLRQTAIDQLNTGIKNFNNDTLFYLQTNSEYNSYDFDHGGFPVILNNSLEFNLSSDYYTLLLTNNHQFTMLKLNDDSAEELLKRSAGYFGYVDRSLILIIVFKFSDFSSEDFRKFTANRNGYYLHGLIKSVYVHKSINAFDGTSWYVGELSGK